MKCAIELRRDERSLVVADIAAHGDHCAALGDGFPRLRETASLVHGQPALDELRLLNNPREHEGRPRCHVRSRPDLGHEHDVASVAAGQVLYAGHERVGLGRQHRRLAIPLLDSPPQLFVIDALRVAQLLARIIRLDQLCARVHLIGHPIELPCLAPGLLRACIVAGRRAV